MIQARANWKSRCLLCWLWKSSHTVNSRYSLGYTTQPFLMWETTQDVHNRTQGLLGATWEATIKAAYWPSPAPGNLSAQRPSFSQELYKSDAHGNARVLLEKGQQLLIPCLLHAGVAQCHTQPPHLCLGSSTHVVSAKRSRRVTSHLGTHHGLEMQHQARPAPRETCSGSIALNWSSGGLKELTSLFKRLRCTCEALGRMCPLWIYALFLEGK